MNCETRSVQVNFPAEATDDCNVMVIEYNATGSTTFASQVDSIAAINVGTTVVTATASDSTGKTSTCQTSITITTGKY